MSCVISFSLYGDLPYYCDGALRNAALAPEIYPGWRCRFYVGDAVPRRYVEGLEDRGCEVIPVHKSLGPMYGRYWRFWVAADPSVERFVVRDADSRLNLREKAAVDEWIQSGKTFHVMRDHPAHNRRVLGGMWGGCGGALPEIAGLVDAWGHYNVQGECDRFLSEVIYPIMGSDYLCHDSSGHFEDARPFPVPCANGETHIGGKVDPATDPDFLAAFERLANRTRQLERELSHVSAHRDALLDSVSWRITAPGRKIADRLGFARPQKGKVLDTHPTPTQATLRQSGASDA